MGCIIVLPHDASQHDTKHFVINLNQTHFRNLFHDMTISVNSLRQLCFVATEGTYGGRVGGNVNCKVMEFIRFTLAYVVGTRPADNALEERRD
jgi:hypothetical protein